MGDNLRQDGKELGSDWLAMWSTGLPPFMTLAG